MKNLKDLNLKWYWRLTKVVYSGLLSLFLMVVILAPIGSIFYGNKSYLPKFLLKEPIVGKDEILESDVLRKAKEQDPNLRVFDDSEIIDIVIQKFPHLKIISSQKNLNLLIVIPFILLCWIFSLVIFYIIHLIIRSITYYIIFGKINFNKNKI